MATQTIKDLAQALKDIVTNVAAAQAALTAFATFLLTY